MRNLRWIGFILIAANACAGEQLAGPDTAERPNIIFFIADDMNREMFNCLPEGKGKNLTPNLDRLAKEGTILKNQYVTSPVCTPSRYNCLTGRYASRAGNKTFLNKTKEEEGQTVIQWNTFITPREKTLPRYLQKAGYKTGMVGKNHVVEVEGLKQFADYWDDPKKPANVRKLEYNYQRNQAAIRRIGFDYAESIYFDNPQFIGLGKLAVQNMDWIAQGGVDFIDRYHRHPFFLYFATTIPHGPTDPEHSWKADPRLTACGYLDKAPEVLPARETLSQRISAAGLDGKNKELVLWLDDALGALLNRLEKYGLMGNTLIFFFNDQGQSAKGHLYQGGVHNPSIIWRSNGFKCGPVCEAIVQNIDFAPTILDFAGVRPAAAEFDGRSFRSILEGGAESVHDSLYFELGYARAVLKGNHKYLAVRYPAYAQNMPLEQRQRVLDAYNQARALRKMRIVNTDPAAPFSHFSVVPGGEDAEHGSYGKLPGYFAADQLYDLAADPKETNNLAGRPEHEEKLREMRAELGAYLNRLPGAFGELNPRDRGKR